MNSPIIVAYCKRGAIIWLNLLTVLLIGPIAWIAAGCAQEHRPSTGHLLGEADAMRSFAVLAGYDDETYYLESPEWENAHERALQSLLSARGNEAWVVLLMLGGHGHAYIAPTTDPSPMFEITVLLDRIPDNVGPAVLWAYTCYLKDTRRHPVGGSEEVKPGVISYWIGQSEPIRELVRRKLVRALNIDKEYDVTAWRAEILRRVQSK